LKEEKLGRDKGEPDGKRMEKVKELAKRERWDEGRDLKNGRKTKLQGSVVSEGAGRGRGEGGGTGERIRVNQRSK